MSSISYAPVSPLPEGSDHSVGARGIRPAATRGPGLLGKAYARVKRIVSWFADLSVDVQRLRALGHAQYPDMRDD